MFRIREPAFEMVELEVVFANGQNEALTFEFAVETEDGVGECSFYEVKAEEGRTATLEAPEGDVIGFRAAVDSYNVSGELLQGDVDEPCPRIVVDYSLRETPAILQSTEVRC